MRYMKAMGVTGSRPAICQMPNISVLESHDINRAILCQRRGAGSKEVRVNLNMINAAIKDGSTFNPIKVKRLHLLALTEPPRWRVAPWPPPATIRRPKTTATFGINGGKTEPYSVMSV